MEFNGVEFDDFDERDKKDGGGFWSQVCKKHAKQFDKNMLSDCPGEPICGVEGCTKVADFYIDF